ncbi:MAG: hypothetical protein LBD86_03175, partial [Spirochaetaceae bacterium]|nr:hypothetical protein [Spirochaetaceae bacterium]
MHIFEYRMKENAYTLYIDERPTNMRIYPVQMGDEPVMLSPDGRIVPSTVWYGEGGPGKRKRRRYASEKEA